MSEVIQTIWVVLAQLLAAWWWFIIQDNNDVVSQLAPCKFMLGSRATLLLWLVGELIGTGRIVTPPRKATRHKPMFQGDLRGTGDLRANPTPWIAAR